MSLPAKPAADARWADGGTIIEPSTGKKALGWIVEKPAYQFFNWLFNTLYGWQLFLDRRLPSSSMELITAAGAYAPDTSRNRELYFDATLGNQSLTLPAIVAGADDGLTFEVKKIDASANTVTITGTVEGDINYAIEQRWTGVVVRAFNGLWYWKA